MKKNFLPAIKLTLLSLILLMGIYPIMLFAIAQLSPNKGESQMLNANGKAYYKHIGQSFTSDHYFWSRPSAVNYNAAGSGASNKAVSNPDYIKEIEERIQDFLKRNPTVNQSEIPVELITASGSGLDPHLSVAALEVQVPRIAKLRNLNAEQVVELIHSHIEKPLFGFLGPEKVHVLELNLALDELKPLK
ncbi:potassium-transporting ATPase subunit KdpC [Sphingobacterium sp. HJSM2_6]|uniref:potassium-transporting ATPase subunit KdpC n=1 Tax=Sphingobacterium sp. HJSM2_6 TaxID=3366264 RepID=UPI003BD4A44E